MAGMAVEAISIGGQETCIQLPGHDLAFDIGRCPHGAVSRNTILFTHTHIDHIGGIAWHCATRALRGLPPPRYVLSQAHAAGVNALFQAYRRLDHSRLPHTLIPLEVGEELPVRAGLVLRPFRSVHRVPCQGYALHERRNKLKPAFTGLSGGEIAALRREGVVVSEEVWVPVFAFTGDTRIEVVEREEVVRLARLLVLECTFVDDLVGVEDCRDAGHVHLYDIAERQDLFANEAILLTHFSARYRQRDILRALDRCLEPAFRCRVTPLLNGHPP